MGVVLHETCGVSACVADLIAAGRRAMWAMLSKCGSFGIGSLSMKVRLFGSLVSPILGYCSEVWAPAVMQGARSATQLLNGGRAMFNPVVVLEADCWLPPSFYQPAGVIEGVWLPAAGTPMASVCCLVVESLCVA